MSGNKPTPLGCEEPGCKDVEELYLDKASGMWCGTGRCVKHRQVAPSGAFAPSERQIQELAEKMAKTFTVEEYGSMLLSAALLRFTALLLATGKLPREVAIHAFTKRFDEAAASTLTVKGEGRPLPALRLVKGDPS